MTTTDRIAPFEGLDLFYTVCPSASGSNLAINRGRIDAAFDGTGATIESIRTSSDRHVREAHYHQDHRHLFREGGNIPPLWARSVGRNIRLLGLAWLDHYSAVISLPGSGIDEPEDLRGRRLGLVRRPNDPVDYPRATAFHAYAATLEAAGIGLDEVSFVDIDLTRPLVGAPPASGFLSAAAFTAEVIRSAQGPQIAALVRGDIDALHVELQGIAIQEILGAHVVFDLTTGLDLAGRVSGPTPIAFTVRGELLDSHPDAVTRYVAEGVRAARWASEHHEDARRWIARDFALPEEDVPRVYSPRVYDSLEPTLEPDLVAAITIQKDFLLEHGFIPEDFDIAEWVAPEPLEAAKALLAAG